MARVLLLLALLVWPAPSPAATLDEIAPRLAAGDFDDRARVVAEIAATGDPRAIPLLELLAAGDLEAWRADGRLVRLDERGSDTVAVDVLTGADVGAAGRRDTEKVRVNNALRRTIRSALGALTLGAPDPAVRAAAAEKVFAARDPEQLPALDAALAAETDAGVRAAMERARAAIVLAAPSTAFDKRAALLTLSAYGDQDTLSVVIAAERDPDPEVAAAAVAARANIERLRLVWDAARNVWFGLSLGSVLMLAAIGLAITFGVMGVINMAHGELVMLGAYTTFVVQEVIRGSAPWLFDWSLLIALPAAFLVAGGVGVAIERGVCRFLYGRPLETLLATWGVSLILQQTVRSIFGPTNQQVGAPSWMAGSFEIGQLSLTYGRFWIVVFSLTVFAFLLLLLKRTPMGLQMRAVTQNRRMASAMGVRTGWVDAMTFGLGAGIAGIAGVALSQIDNVSPNLGQTYIVDSFMVVVFGGVGNLWGALAGAFTLGVANKFLEPYAGAVLAKVLVLVFIILFIQKRPRGLFALKGRAVEG
jgi:urea transport system permease protein